MERDEDLDFLYDLSIDELEVLAQIIIKKGEPSQMLSVRKEYEERSTYSCGGCHNDKKNVYVNLIEDELRRFAGNTIINMIRGNGVSYKELLCDVCDNLGVSYNKNSNVPLIESYLLQKVLVDTWDKMSNEDKEKVFEELGGSDAGWKGMTAATMGVLFKKGGFYSYKVLATLVNGISKLFIGKGLSFGANAVLTKTASIITGPIGMALATVWTIADVAGPGYRVTVPAAIYIAAMRGICGESRRISNHSI